MLKIQLWYQMSFSLLFAWPILTHLAALFIYFYYFLILSLYITTVQQRIQTLQGTSHWDVILRIWMVSEVKVISQNIITCSEDSSGLEYCWVALDVLKDCSIFIFWIKQLRSVFFLNCFKMFGITNIHTWGRPYSVHLDLAWPSVTDPCG
jgi:hypothetical protein